MEHQARQSSTRIPRDAQDDHSPAAVAARQAYWTAWRGAPPRHVAGVPVEPGAARGKIENLVGFAQVPLGLAGPLRVRGAEGEYEVCVPLATTEGALVASTSRGMRLLAAGGGARARVLSSRLTQNPMLVYADAESAWRAAQLVPARLAAWRELVSGTTRHGALLDARAELAGRRLVLVLGFSTGDALGVNMASRAADLVSADLAAATKPLERHVHGEDVEKRANARARLEGRGRSAVAEVVVPRDALREIARATPEALVSLLRSYTVGFERLGTQNHLVQSANTLAALYLATGQDVAYVGESAVGGLDFATTSEGDLHASAHLPCLHLGTVGGGTGQGTARECLELMGCLGDGKATRLAEIAAATVLAGDLSLMAAFVAGEFVAAHERLGRNRPS
ncbi:MAG: hypothetical protein RL112_1516 [Planctomycetota bacterium]